MRQRQGFVFAACPLQLTGALVAPPVRAAHRLHLCPCAGDPAVAVSVSDQPLQREPTPRWFNTGGIRLASDSMKTGDLFTPFLPHLAWMRLSLAHCLSTAVVFSQMEKRTGLRSHVRLSPSRLLEAALDRCSFRAASFGASVLLLSSDLTSCLTSGRFLGSTSASLTF